MGHAFAAQQLVQHAGSLVTVTEDQRCLDRIGQRTCHQMQVVGQVKRRVATPTMSSSAPASAMATAAMRMCARRITLRREALPDRNNFMATSCGAQAAAPWD
ncbi:hypothetical protein HQS1_31380 [Delftia lacustris]|nr:hypothetical protein HQS1_31380 [Delftia lacustris]